MRHPCANSLRATYSGTARAALPSSEGGWVGEREATDLRHAVRESRHRRVASLGPMSEGAGTAEVHHFMTLVNRVASDDASIRRRVDALSPDQRVAVAGEVVEYANGMENDEMGRHLIKEAIRRALP